ncbi:MAG: GNAT family N-acetyltransferase [Alphaproteobacteria bacterium]|nr:GNAT family N-acetyltransferase [Alphaproteobacteria bacterium]
MAVEILPVQVEAILAIRSRVLRPDRTPEQCRLIEDDEAATCHWAARTGGAVVGCVTILPQRVPPRLPGNPPPINPIVDSLWAGRSGWRVRGMAVLPDQQSLGIGALLIEAAVAEVRRRAADLVWCYGRLTADRFYRRAGFVPSGPSFDTPPTGLHHLYLMALGSGEGA